MSPRLSCRRAALYQPNVLDDGEFELAAGAPDAVGDQLGVEAVDERFGERVAVGVADRSDRGKHAMVDERLAVVDAGVLPEFKRPSQRCRFTQGIVVRSPAVLDPVDIWVRCVVRDSSWRLRSASQRAVSRPRGWRSLVAVRPRRW